MPARHDGRAARAAADRIGRFGPRPFDEIMDIALYRPEGGFFTGTGRAGRRGDFITSPEVGPLFGLLVGRWLDQVWDGLGRPEPFVVIEGGAGVGTLARSVLASSPACAAALRYVLVERSAAMRAEHRNHLPWVDPAFVLPPSGDPDDLDPDGRPEPVLDGPWVTSLADLPAVAVDGAVVANELLDNLPFRVFQKVTDGWAEVLVGLAEGPEPERDSYGGAAEVLGEVLVPAGAEVSGVLERLAPDAGPGARVPWQRVAVEWVRSASERLRSGRLLLLDYAAPTAELGRRSTGPLDGGRAQAAPAGGRSARGQWLRTYRDHASGGPPLHDLGEQDITADVATDQVSAPLGRVDETDQATFLRRLGIDDLVEDGRRRWEERAHVGDLAAVAARSRVREAEALLDPDGLGAFTVLEWQVPPHP